MSRRNHIEPNPKILVGKPVARMARMTGRRELSAEQRAALERSRRRMRRGMDLGGQMPSRDELHER